MPHFQTCYVKCSYWKYLIVPKPCSMFTSYCSVVGDTSIISMPVNITDNSLSCVIFPYMRCKYRMLDGTKCVVRSRGFYLSAVLNIKLAAVVVIYTAREITSVLIKNRDVVGYMAGHKSSFSVTVS